MTIFDALKALMKDIVMVYLLGLSGGHPDYAAAKPAILKLNAGFNLPSALHRHQTLPVSSQPVTVKAVASPPDFSEKFRP